MDKPKFLERYEQEMRFSNETKPTRVDRELYDILKIIKSSITMVNHIPRREDDISKILNTYVKWDQLLIDGKEATEYLQRKNKETIDQLERLEYISKPQSAKKNQ